MAVIETVEPAAEEIEDALRFFGSDPDALRYIGELLNEQELGDLRRTIVGTSTAEEAEKAIDAHPFASHSRKAKFRIALFLWGGHVRFRWEDPRRFDPENREKFIRAMRVFVGLPAAPSVTTRRRAQAPHFNGGLASLKYAGGFPPTVPGGTGESTPVETGPPPHREGRRVRSKKQEPPLASAVAR